MIIANTKARLKPKAKTWPVGIIIALKNNNKIIIIIIK